MNDYSLIEMNIRRARLERSAVLGTLIGTAIAAAWIATNNGAHQLSAHIKSLGHSHAKSTKAPAAFV